MAFLSPKTLKALRLIQDFSCQEGEHVDLFEQITAEALQSDGFSEMRFNNRSNAIFLLNALRRLLESIEPNSIDALEVLTKEA